MHPWRCGPRAALAALVGVLVLPATASDPVPSDKRIFYLGSYDKGDEWADGLEGAARNLLQVAGVQTRVFRMGLKRGSTEGAWAEAAAKARAAIETFQPHVVVIAGKPAVKSVLAGHFKGSTLSFVACGLEGDAAAYGLPQPNATGIVAGSRTRELVDLMREYAGGPRVGVLAADDATGRALAGAVERAGGPLVRRHVKGAAEWKEAFRALQSQVDLLVLGDLSDVPGLDPADAAAFAGANGKVVSGTVDEGATPAAMVALTSLPSEVGTWAAKNALAVANGASVASVPVMVGRRTRTTLNVKLASAIGIIFKPGLVKEAQIVR